MQKFLLNIIILASFISFPQVKDDSFQLAINSLSKENIKRHLSYLGSDLFEGRGTGTTGGSLAAKYLAAEFDKLNLKPLGYNETYYQYIQMHGSVPLSSSELILYENEKKSNLTYLKDYLLYKTGEQTFIPKPIPLVFVGYGIIAPEFDYNDYQSVDVNGKIAVMLSGEPFSEDLSYFDGLNPTIFSYPDSKQRIAISRGAKGSIIIPNINDVKYSNWDRLVQEFSFEDVTLAYSASANFGMLINPQTAGKLFENSEYNLTDIFTMQKENRMISFPLESRMSFKGEFKQRDFVAPNIIGMLPGSDPELKDSYLILSAHYDHLGIGPPVKGDSIYNGVQDNAIGVAALLEIASAFTKLRKPPQRSILFLLVTGEEKGLLGSTYYTDHPSLPLYKTVANINIDGIAAIDKFNSIIGVGAELSTLEEFLSLSALEMNLKVVSLPPIFEQSESFYRSDQIAFAAAGIPSMLITDAPDYKNISAEEAVKRNIDFIQNIYHTPFDDLSQPINFDAVIQHMQIIFHTAYNIATFKNEPEWKKGSQYINARLRSKAERK